MELPGQEVLCPIAEQEAIARSDVISGRTGKGKAVIGLLSNSKPNVDFFLAAIERELLVRSDAYETFKVVKSRSAAPCGDLDLLAERCDYVINAVAD
jgi:hypothetical protein